MRQPLFIILCALLALFAEEQKYRVEVPSLLPNNIPHTTHDISQYCDTTGYFSYSFDTLQQKIVVTLGEQTLFTTLEKKFSEDSTLSKEVTLPYSLGHIQNIITEEMNQALNSGYPFVSIAPILVKDTLTILITLGEESEECKLKILTTKKMVGLLMIKYKMILRTLKNKQNGRMPRCKLGLRSPYHVGAQCRFES